MAVISSFKYPKRNPKLKQLTQQHSYTQVLGRQVSALEVKLWAETSASSIRVPGSSLGSGPRASSLLTCILGGKGIGSSSCSTHTGNTNGPPGFRLPPGPVQFAVGPEGVNQQIAFFLSFSRIPSLLWCQFLKRLGKYLSVQPHPSSVPSCYTAWLDYASAGRKGTPPPQAPVSSFHVAREAETPPSHP